MPPEKELTMYQKVAAAIAAGTNEDLIKEFAEKALKEVVSDYRTKNEIEELVRPDAIKMAQSIIPTDIFQAKLKLKVEEELVGILDCAVKQVCLKIITALQKK